MNWRGGLDVRHTDFDRRLVIVVARPAGQAIGDATGRPLGVVVVMVGHCGGGSSDGGGAGPLLMGAHAGRSWECGSSRQRRRIVHGRRDDGLPLHRYRVCRDVPLAAAHAPDWPGRGICAPRCQINVSRVPTPSRSPNAKGGSNDGGGGGGGGGDGWEV